MRRCITKLKNYADDIEKRKEIVAEIIGRSYGKEMTYIKTRRFFGQAVSKLVGSNSYEELKLLYGYAKSLFGKLIIDIDETGRILTVTESPIGYDGDLIREYTGAGLKTIGTAFGNNSPSQENYRVNPDDVKSSREYDEKRTELLKKMAKELGIDGYF